MKKSVSKPPSKLRIEFTDLFIRQRKKAPLETKIAFREALALFIEDQFHPHLRNHSLKRELVGYRSIDVTEDWRALFKITKTNKQEIVTFHKIGIHKELYKKKGSIK